MIETRPSKPMHHRPLNRSESIDAVQVETVPRYKTSGMSGDEWSFGAVARLSFKGEVVLERSYRDVETAATALPWILMTWCEEGSSDEGVRRISGLRARCCDNYGCSEPWVAKYRIKRLTSASGEWLDEKEQDYYDYYRQFCQRHLRRGDCSREDCDDNYEVIDTANADCAISGPETLVIADVGES